MRVFGHLFGHDKGKEIHELLPTIERAVSRVEPLLRQVSGYPENYRTSVTAALEYAHSLAASIPGPVVINKESYAMDPFVHALFPSLDFVQDAFCTSRALLDYHHEPSPTEELYALMGMRRCEKKIVGMELSGQTIQRDVVQNVVYFTSHTIEYPAPSEKQARDQVALGVFDSLVGKVKKRVAARKQGKQSLLQERDMLMSRLRKADAETRPSLEEELSKLLDNLQSAVDLLDLRKYVEDFEAVLLNPEQHLRLNQTPIIMDSMGIRLDNGDTRTVEPVIFHDLIGFDRRDWTVTMVCCGNIPSESFAMRLEKANRRLAV